MISKKGELVNRKCKACNQKKKSKHFYRSLLVCKECTKIKRAEWRKNNPDKTKKSRKAWRVKNKDRIREYQKEWNKKNPNYRKEWREKHPGCIIKGRRKTDPEYSKKARQKQPHVHRVAMLVYHAIRKGEISKPGICKRCKKEKRILAHHENYDSPFEITWLCYSCHKIIHYQKRRMKMNKHYNPIKFYIKTSLFEKIRYYISRIRGRG